MSAGRTAFFLTANGPLRAPDRSKSLMSSSNTRSCSALSIGSSFRVSCPPDAKPSNPTTGNGAFAFSFSFTPETLNLTRSVSEDRLDEDPEAEECEDRLSNEDRGRPEGGEAGEGREGDDGEEGPAGGGVSQAVRTAVHRLNASTPASSPASKGRNPLGREDEGVGRELEVDPEEEGPGEGPVGAGDPDPVRLPGVVDMHAASLSSNHLVVSLLRRWIGKWSIARKGRTVLSSRFRGIRSAAGDEIAARARPGPEPTEWIPMQRCFLGVSEGQRYGTGVQQSGLRDAVTNWRASRPSESEGNQLEAKRSRLRLSRERSCVLFQQHAYIIRT